MGEKGAKSCHGTKTQKVENVETGFWGPQGPSRRAIRPAGTKQNHPAYNRRAAGLSDIVNRNGKKNAGAGLTEPNRSCGNASKVYQKPGPWPAQENKNKKFANAKKRANAGGGFKYEPSPDGIDFHGGGPQGKVGDAGRGGKQADHVATGPHETRRNLFGLG